jgi:hypothetical protein
MFGCVMCGVDILLWSGRGIASYALTLRRVGAEEGADSLPSLRSAPRASLLPSIIGLSPKPIAPRLPHAPKAIRICMCKCSVCLESPSAWHDRRRSLFLCPHSQQICPTLSAGPQMRFRTWPNTHRLTGLCSKTAWCHDSRPLKYFEALLGGSLTSLLTLSRASARMIQMSHH